MNKLIIRIRSHLKDISDVIAGFITMSSELEVIYENIFNGFIPESWKALAPFTNKKLASWVNQLILRVEQ